MMENKNKKIVLFDFDGVLVDTLDIYHSISCEVNGDMDIEEYKTFFEGNIHDAVRKDGSKRIPHTFFHERFMHYVQNVREVKIPEILKAMLGELSKKYLLFIVSSTPNKTLEHLLEAEGVREYFTDIMGSGVHTSKVVKNKMVLEKYNVLPKDAVFITDTLGDIREARECDIDSIAVTWGFHERKTLEKGNPIVIVSDPRELFVEIDNVLK